MISLRARLLLGIGASTAAALVVLAVLVYRLESGALYDGYDRALRTRTQGLAALVEQEADGIENDLGRSNLPEFSRTERPHYFQLWMPDGTIIERSRSLGTTSLEPQAGPPHSLVITAVTLPSGERGRQATLRFVPRLDPDDPGVMSRPDDLVLVYAYDVADVEASLARMRSVLLLAVPAITALVLLILVVVVSVGLRPVGGLARDISAIDVRALASLPSRAALPPELAPIRARLDELVARLADALARERQITAELAHELRTPVTGLKVTLELALSRDREPEAYRVALRECLAICEQTQRTVEALLVLTRLDAGMVAPTRSPVDLLALVVRTLPPFVHQAAQRGVAVDEQLVACSLTTDPDVLQIVLNNLFDNAVRYVDEEGSIRVELRLGTTTAALSVANTGSVLGPDEIQHATARFWRGDGARSVGMHAGLGLSLVHEAVTLLGGTLTLASERGSWFTATVVLPRHS